MSFGLVFWSCLLAMSFGRFFWSRLLVVPFGHVFLGMSFGHVFLVMLSGHALWPCLLAMPFDHVFWLELDQNLVDQNQPKICANRQIVVGKSSGKWAKTSWAKIDQNLRKSVKNQPKLRKLRNFQKIDQNLWKWAKISGDFGPFSGRFPDYTLSIGADFWSILIQEILSISKDFGALPEIAVDFLEISQFPQFWLIFD